MLELGVTISFLVYAILFLCAQLSGDTFYSESLSPPSVLINSWQREKQFCQKYVDIDLELRGFVFKCSFDCRVGRKGLDIQCSEYLPAGPITRMPMNTIASNPNTRCRLRFRSTGGSMFSGSISVTKRGSSKLKCFSSSSAIMNTVCFITPEMQLVENLVRRRNRFRECTAGMGDSVGLDVEAIRISNSQRPSECQ